MASIGLPQESRHPSYLSIDLYATSLNLRFVCAQKSAVDSLNRPQPEACAQKMTSRGGFGLWIYVGGNGYRCTACSSSPAEDMFAEVTNHRLEGGGSR